MRGFYHCLDILKADFLQILKQQGLLDRFISFLVSEIDNNSAMQASDLVSISLLESHAEFIRTEVLNSFDMSFSEISKRDERKLTVLAMGGDALHTVFTNKV